MKTENRSSLYYDKWRYRIIISNNERHIMHYINNAVPCRNSYSNKSPYFSFNNFSKSYYTYIYFNDLGVIDNLQGLELNITEANVCLPRNYIIVKKEPKFRYRITARVNTVECLLAVCEYLVANKDRLKMNKNAEYLIHYIDNNSYIRLARSVITFDSNEEEDLTMLRLKNINAKMREVISEDKAKLIYGEHNA